MQEILDKLANRLLRGQSALTDVFITAALVWAGGVAVQQAIGHLAMSVRSVLDRPSGATLIPLIAYLTPVAGLTPQSGNLAF